MAINQALPCSPVWVLQLLFVFQLQELDTDTTTPSVQHWKAGSGPGNKTIRLKLMSNFQPLCVHVYSMPHCEHTFNAKEYQYSYNSYSVTTYITESHAHLQVSIALCQGSTRGISLLKIIVCVEGPSICCKRNCVSLLSKQESARVSLSICGMSLREQ